MSYVKKIMEKPFITPQVQSRFEHKLRSAEAKVEEYKAILKKPIKEIKTNV